MLTDVEGTASHVFPFKGFHGVFCVFVVFVVNESIRTLEASKARG